MRHKVLTIVKEAFGENDPKVATALNDLAIMLNEQVRP